VLAEATDKGIKIVFINSAMEGIKYEALLETNGMELGKNAAKTSNQLLNGQGEVCVGIWSDLKISSIEKRAEGFMKELTNNYGVKVFRIKISSSPTEDEVARVITAIKKEHPNVKLLFATDVNWGVAYANYIKKHKTDLLIVTVDFNAEIAELINSGYIKAAIAQRAFSWGTMSLDYLADVFQGKQVKKYTDTGTYEVNINNLAVYKNRI
jgi:ABC-type sugar transport system substrate-binding protein